MGVSLTVLVRGLGVENLKRARQALESLAGALTSRATDSLRVSVVSALPESPFNLAKVAGTAVTGRDWSGDFARLQNIDVLLSSRASETTLSSIRDRLPSSLTGAGNLRTAIMEPLPYGENPIGFLWRGVGTRIISDYSTYTVTATSWTLLKSYWEPRNVGMVMVLGIAIQAYVAASGQTLYVRVRNRGGETLLSGTWTETSPTWRAFIVTNKYFGFPDADTFYLEAYVGGAGQTGYITNFYIVTNPYLAPVYGWDWGIGPGFRLYPLRVDSEGYLRQGLDRISGTPLTARDWSSDFARLQNLDVLLSTRASEATLAGIRSQTDKLTFDTSSRLKVNVEVIANPPNLDVQLSSFVGMPDQSPPGRGVVLLGFDGTYLRRVRVTPDGRLLATLV